MANRPARKDSETYPTLVQTTTAETSGSAKLGSESHPMECPSKVLTAPSVGARIQRHSTAIASGAQIHGSTYTVRNSPVPGSRRASIDAASSPKTVCAGTTRATKAAVTISELPKPESASTDRQLARPT